MDGGRRFRYPRSARIRSGSEIRSLLNEGARRRGEALDVFVRPSRTSAARAGVVVPRHGHSIVERNRLKRRLRELVRTRWLPVARGREPRPEMLVRTRPGAYRLSGRELRAEFERCAGVAP